MDQNQKQTFTVQLDKATADKLAKLAATSDRSRGAVVRLLIRQAAVPVKAEAQYATA